MRRMRQRRRALKFGDSWLLNHGARYLAVTLKGVSSDVSQELKLNQELRLSQKLKLDQKLKLNLEQRSSSRN